MHSRGHWLREYISVNNVYMLAIGLVAIMLTNPVKGQDPVFSRQISNLHNENPAFAGGSRNAIVYAVYRNQFPSLNAQYVTYALGFSFFEDDLNSGFGIGFLHDDSADGLYQTTGLDLKYSYRLQLLDNAYLSAGISLGLGRTEVDFDRLLFADQIDPVNGPVSGGGIPFPTDEFRPDAEAVNYADLGAGFLFYGNRFYVGASFNHLNNPNDDFLVNEFETTPAIDGLPLRWSIMGGGNIPLLESFRETIISLHPQFLYSRQRDFGQLQLGAHVKYRIIDVGASARLSGQTADALIFTFGMNVDALRFYYAHDFTISSLASNTGGSHELGILCRIGPEQKAEVECFDLYR